LIKKWYHSFFHFFGGGFKLDSAVLKKMEEAVILFLGQEPQQITLYVITD